MLKAAITIRILRLLGLAAIMCYGSSLANVENSLLIGPTHWGMRAYVDNCRPGAVDVSVDIPMADLPTGADDKLRSLFWFPVVDAMKHCNIYHDADAYVVLRGYDGLQIRLRLRFQRQDHSINIVNAVTERHSQELPIDHAALAYYEEIWSSILEGNGYQLDRVFRDKLTEKYSQWQNPDFLYHSAFDGCDTKSLQCNPNREKLQQAADLGHPSAAHEYALAVMRETGLLGKPAHYDTARYDENQLNEITLYTAKAIRWNYALAIHLGKFLRIGGFPLDRAISLVADSGPSTPPSLLKKLAPTGPPTKAAVRQTANEHFLKHYCSDVVALLGGVSANQPLALASFLFAGDVHVSGNWCAVNIAGSPVLSFRVGDMHSVDCASRNNDGFFCAFIFGLECRIEMLGTTPLYEAIACIAPRVARLNGEAMLRRIETGVGWTATSVTLKSR